MGATLSDAPALGARAQRWFAGEFDAAVDLPVAVVCVVLNMDATAPPRDRDRAGARGSTQAVLWIVRSERTMVPTACIIVLLGRAGPSKAGGDPARPTYLPVFVCPRSRRT